MSEPIEKIVDNGIGSDYNSGQVYWFKYWKNRRANLSDDLVSNRESSSADLISKIYIS